MFLSFAGARISSLLTSLLCSIVGSYNDEFYEDASVLVNCEVVKIEDIEKVELIGEEIQ